ncbi:MAG: Thiol:disulfide interchange protein DsbD precursor, partial [Verrucomicrobiota bacterium]
MKTLKPLLLAVALLLPFTAQAERPRSPFGVGADLRMSENIPVLRVQFTVPTDCVLYSERIHFETADGGELVPVKLPAPVVAVDKATGHEKKLYDRNFAVDLRPFAGDLIVKFQGCSNNACFFPEKRTFAVNPSGVYAEALPKIVAPVEIAADPNAPSDDWQSAAGDFKVVAKETGYLKSGNFVSFLNRSASGHVEASNDPLAKYKKFGLAVTMIFIVLGGLALNLTPCVLPLIPINLAIIGAGKAAHTRREGFMHGATYGAGVALAYGVLGLVVVLTGAKFGTLNSSIWFNVGIAIVFGFLSLAMFGKFNMDFSRYEAGMGDKLRGVKSRSLIAFGLGAIAALLAGACVAPVVISVLLLATDLHAKGVAIGLALP